MKPSAILCLSVMMASICSGQAPIPPSGPAAPAYTSPPGPSGGSPGVYVPSNQPLGPGEPATQPGVIRIDKDGLVCFRMASVK